MSDTGSQQTDAADAQGQAAFDPDRVIAELEQGVGRLPEAAIRQARAHRDVMVPRLIKAIEDATAMIRQGKKVETNGHFFALFLLAEFQAREALPAVVEAISLPGEGPHDLFGGAVTENLAGILATLSDDPLSLIDGLIQNSGLDEYVRWEAAQVYSHLVRDGRLRREDAIEHLRQHLRREMQKADGSEIVTGLVHTLYDLWPKEAYEEIKQAFEEGLVETFMMDMKSIDHCIAEGEAGLQRRLGNLRIVGDTIEELRQWACFRPEPPARINSAKLALAPLPAEGYGKPRRAAEAGSARRPAIPPAQPVAAKRAGRNDPCPCGSGKKYKKCCLDKDTGR
ncbi:MAG: DUF1186 domain-containing protein [Tepidisphaeraceae bacterium]